MSKVLPGLAVMLIVGCLLVAGCRGVWYWFCEAEVGIISQGLGS